MLCYSNGTDNELKQRLVDVWQSAAERHWRDHQRVEKATESMHAYRWTTFWTHIVSISWDWNRHGQIFQLTLFLLEKMSFYRWFVIFGVLVSQGKVRTRNRWGGKLNHHLLTVYLLTNICTKNHRSKVKVTRSSSALPAWVCRSIGLHRFLPRHAL